MTEKVVIGKNTKEIKFPKKCVYCGEPYKGKTFRVRSSISGLYGIVFWLLRKNETLDVPAHNLCWRKFEKIKHITNVALFVVVNILLLIFLTASYLGIQLPFEPTQTKLIIIVIAIIIPVSFWEVIYLRAFEFRVGNKIIQFEFPNMELAKEFAKLNGVQVGETKESIGELVGDAMRIGNKMKK